MTAQNLLGGLALEEGHLAQIAARAVQLASEATTQAILAELKTLENPTGTALVVSGTRDRFRDGFTTGTPARPVDPAVWSLLNDAPDTGDGRGHLVLPGGDSQGAAYLRVSLSPFVAGSGVQLASVAKFAVPIRHAWGVSASQRATGQDISFGLAEGLDGNGTLQVNTTPQPADLQLPATITTASNVATIVFPAPHGLKGSDRVLLVGNSRRELDFGPVYVTVVDALTITLVTPVLANATYNAGGVLRVVDPSANLNNCALQLWGDTVTATQATPVSRRNGTKSRVLVNQGALTSAPIQSNTSAHSDAWLATGPTEIWANIDEVVWRSWADGVAGMSGYTKFQQSIPDETQSYRLYVRARNLDNLSRPIARIVSAAKTGTTTATITTDVPHGLAVGDTLTIVGIRDTTNFPSAAVTVASVTGPTTFTAPFGLAVTLTDTLGGVVWLNRGGVSTPGMIGNGYVQSVASTTPGVLQIVTSTTIATAAVGDLANLYGLAPAAAQYEGVYRLLRVNGATSEWAPVVTAWAGTTFGSITTGGNLIRRTDVRLHFARILAHTRMLTEIMGGRGNVVDNNNAVPVALTSGTTLVVNANASQVSLDTATFEGNALSTTNLVASGVFSMTARDSGAAVSARDTMVRVLVQHVAGNTPGVLTLEESVDNVTFRETRRVPIPSEIDGARYRAVELPITVRYWRVKFTNGTTAQTAFWFGCLSFRGQPNNEAVKNMGFPLTPGAGSALAASATFTGPTLDLGVNHGWNTVRAIVGSDQASAANGVYVQHSIDGVTWFTTGATQTLTAGGSASWEAQIGARFVRLVVVNSTTAATALRAHLALLGNP